MYVCMRPSNHIYHDVREVVVRSSGRKKEREREGKEKRETASVSHGSGTLDDFRFFFSFFFLPFPNAPASLTRDLLTVRRDGERTGRDGCLFRLSAG